MKSPFEPEFTKHKPETCEGFMHPCDNTNAEWGHNSTMYEDENSNWSYLCPECREFSDDHWKAMWAMIDAVQPA